MIEASQVYGDAILPVLGHDLSRMNLYAVAPLRVQVDAGCFSGCRFAGVRERPEVRGMLLVGERA